MSILKGSVKSRICLIYNVKPSAGPENAGAPKTLDGKLDAVRLAIVGEREPSVQFIVAFHEQLSPEQPQRLETAESITRPLRGCKRRLNDGQTPSSL